MGGQRNSPQAPPKRVRWRRRAGGVRRGRGVQGRRGQPDPLEGAEGVLGGAAGAPPWHPSPPRRHWRPPLAVVSSPWPRPCGFGSGSRPCAWSGGGSPAGGGSDTTQGFFWGWGGEPLDPPPPITTRPLGVPHHHSQLPQVREPGILGGGPRHPGHPPPPTQGGPTPPPPPPSPRCVWGGSLKSQKTPPMAKGTQASRPTHPDTPKGGNPRDLPQGFGGVPG